MKPPRIRQAHLGNHSGEDRSRVGPCVREDVPPEQWDTREHPELRIISDELWARVQAVRTQKVTIGIKKTGGMDRTAASRRYLLSGLMTCGQCGGHIIVVTSKPTRYGCSNHRNRGTDACTNRTTVKQEELEKAFLAALCDNLRADKMREELIHSLHNYLAEQRCLQEAADKTMLEKREEMVSNRAKSLRHQANLLQAIREEGGCRSLCEDLKQVEGKIACLDERLAHGEGPTVAPINIDEVRGFVNANIHRFEELLMGSAGQVMAEFQKRITAITLTPTVDDSGPVYKVTGDVDLFSAVDDVMQTNQLDLIGLQSNTPIAFEVVPYQSQLKWALPQAA